MCRNPDTHPPILLMELMDISLTRFLVDSPVTPPLHAKSTINVFQLKGLYVYVFVHAHAPKMLQESYYELCINCYQLLLISLV